MAVETLIEDERWREANLPDLVERAAAAALSHLGFDPDSCEIAVLACDDARIAALNAEFRDKPAATNVLSWPVVDLAAVEDGGVPEPPVADGTGEVGLGDIAIAYDTCAREAHAEGKSLADHATHLIVHGVLHLLGYDHVRDRDATLMEKTEAKILGTLGIDDPYR